MNHLYARPGLTTYIIQWRDRNGHWHNLQADDGTTLELISANHAKTVVKLALHKVASEIMWATVPVRWQIKDSHGEVVLTGTYQSGGVLILRGL